MKWKKVTIFISSTFNDMHSERDYLVKNVFPELREWCEERKIHLVDVDLRWGVTKEDTENKNTVGTCLKNIDKSRPFFLCFLGQRRGWVPPEISEETKATYPQLEGRMEDKSVTEIEIEHALLEPMYRKVIENDEEKDIQCESAKHTLFFFRDDDYLNNLSEAQKNIYTNEGERHNKDYCLKNLNPDERVQHADSKLKEFKQRILDEEEKDFIINQYKGTWNKEYVVPELLHMKDEVAKGGFSYFEIKDKSLKETILCQLKEEIEKKFDNQYGEGYLDKRKMVKSDGLEKELSQQDLFKEINTQGFIKREKSFQELNSYLKNDKNGLCLLTAKAGIGKTMLLANYISTLEEQIENKYINDLNVYYRFAGVSDKSGQQYDVWRTLIEEIAINLPEDKNDLDDWIPDFEKLKGNINDVLEAIANKNQDKQTLIIIDGINQLDNGLDMIHWLGNNLPENLKIILSFKEDDTEENQKLVDNIDMDENYSHITIDELKKPEDKKDIINEYLKQFLKKLNDDDIETIINSPGSENPLFLKILLSELRVHGQFDTIEEKIAQYHDTPQEAFKTVLNRLENEYLYTKIDISSKEITELIFGLIANARYGLSEEELIDCINIHKENENQIPFEIEDEKEELKQTIRLYLRQVKPFMKVTEKRHDFFYEAFQIATEEKYNDGEHFNKEYYNSLLADYFQLKTDPEENYTFKGRNSRNFNELPYHLAKSDQIAILEEILSKYIWIKNKSELNNIFNTIDDYKYINIESKENYHLKMIKNTLSMSSHILKDNIKELPTQLWGRLKTNENPKIQEELLTEIEKHTNYPWLKPHHLIQTPEGPLQKTLTHTSEVMSVCFSPDGKYIASGSWDKTVRVWNRERPEESPRILTGHTSYVSSVCFSPDGKYIASGSQYPDNTVRVWNREKPEESPRILRGHTERVWSVCFSPDGKYIASGSSDKTVRVWNCESPDESPRILWQRIGSVCVFFS
ncbi:MAG: DUF4062 domain-containing protein [Methanobrevibacter sp.]|nr:DUF4062 domain-containing protein [Methanobrevibacter sp.]